MSEAAKREKKEIIISENRDFKGVWTPHKLYLARNLSASKKNLLIEIHSLTKNGNRKCFASNKHFSDFLGLKENTIKRMLSDLEKEGYIKRIYKYVGDTKEFESRIIKLTNKFYNEFINEYEESEDDEENIGGGEKSTPSWNEIDGVVDFIPQGGGKDSTISNASFKNNNLRDTDLSDTKEDKTLSNDNGEVKTSSSENRKKMSEPKTALEKYLGKKADEQDMLERLANICSKNYDRDTANEIFASLMHYFEKFKTKSGKIHPILKDSTLLRFTEKMDCFYDDKYSHFGRLIRQDNAYIKMIDMFLDGDFGAIKGYDTNYHLSAFMSDEVLNRLAQRLFELGEVE